MRISVLLIAAIVSVSVNVQAQKSNFLKYFEIIKIKGNDNLVTLSKGEEIQVIVWNGQDDFAQQAASLLAQGYVQVGTWIGLPNYTDKANKKRAIKEAKKRGVQVVMSSSMFLSSNFYILQKNPPKLQQTSISAKQQSGPRLGVELRDLTIEERQQIERNKGAYVTNVLEDLPAFEANIIPGDILIEVNGLEVKNTEQAIVLINAAEAGKDLIITVIRKGTEREITVKL